MNHSLLRIFFPQLESIKSESTNNATKDGDPPRRIRASVTNIMPIPKYIDSMNPLFLSQVR